MKVEFLVVVKGFIADTLGECFGGLKKAKSQSLYLIAAEPLLNLLQQLTRRM